MWQVRLWKLFGACGAGGNVAAAETSINGRAWQAHDLDGVAGRRLVAEIAVIVEEGWGVEARSDGDLGDDRLRAGSGDTARASTVDEAQRDLIALDQVDERGTAFGNFA